MSLSVSLTYILDCSVSDPFLVLHLLPQAVEIVPTVYTYSSYQINNENLRNLARERSSIEWMKVILNDDTELAFNEFYPCLMLNFYGHFPHINRSNQGNRDKPWFTSSLNCMKRKKISCIANIENCRLNSIRRLIEYVKTILTPPLEGRS